MHDMPLYRIKQGQCPTCGIQTYKKSLGRSIPINNEYVTYGRCNQNQCNLGTLAAPARPATGEAPGASVVTIPSGELAQGNAGAPFNPSIILPPPENLAASSLNNSAIVPLQNQGDVLNDGPPAPTTEADNAPPVSTDQGQHSDIEGGNPWW